MKKAITFLATVGGTGYLPYMPGTFGTLWGILLLYLLQNLSTTSYCIFLVCFIGAASFICDIAGKNLGVVDDQRIVLDEVVGYMVAMFTFQFNWLYIVIGFVFMRTFDILKPFPIHHIDKRIKNGFGVVFDDVVAGIYANLTLQVVSLFL